ncbi:MAG: hypothetical protein ACKVXR_16980 [Planctomycetota bacterium]
MLKRVLLALGLLVLAVAGWLVYEIGPRNIIGMLRYDQRREGDYKAGDKAPDVVLKALDGVTDVRLLDARQGKPLILIFGSYT